MSYRKASHFAELRGGYHSNIHLQRAFNKYGEKYFIWGVVVHCPELCLLPVEQHYLDTLKPRYNILKIAGTTRGFKHSPEAKAKIVAAGKRPCSEETKQKIREAHLKTGHGKQPANLDRVRVLNIGRKLTLETKNKISLSAKSLNTINAIELWRKSPDYNSEENKKKRSEMVKKSWATRKAYRIGA